MRSSLPAVEGGAGTTASILAFNLLAGRSVILSLQWVDGTWPTPQLCVLVLTDPILLEKGRDVAPADVAA